MIELAEDHKRIIDAVTERYFYGESWWSEGRTLRGMVRAGSLEARRERLRILVPDYLQETPQDSFAPSLLGALASSTGSRVRVLLLATFAVVKRRFAEDREFSRFTTREVAEELAIRGEALAPADEEVLKRLYVLSGLSSPATGPEPAWTTPQAIEELDDLKAEADCLSFAIEHAREKQLAIAAFLSAHAPQSWRAPGRTSRREREEAVRALLAYFHAAYEDVGSEAFSIDPEDDEVLADLGLSASQVRSATIHLVDIGLLEPNTLGGRYTITAAGVAAAEDASDESSGGESRSIDSPPTDADSSLRSLLDVYRATGLGTDRRWQLADSILATNARWTKSLDDMYVPITYRVEAGPSPTGINRRGRVDRASAFEPLKRVLLVGNGGSGKSTALRWLYRRMLEQPDVLPIFLSTLHLTGTRREHVIQSAIESELNKLAEGLGGQFTQCCRNRAVLRNVVLLIDGWDEYGDRGDSLRAELERLLSQHDSLSVVATSRPHALSKPSIVEGFSECLIESFQWDQARELLGKYFAMVESLAPDGVVERVNAVLSSAHANGISDLLSSPFDLLVLARANFDKRTRSRVALYDQIVRMMLAVRPSQKAASGAQTSRAQWAPDSEVDRLKAAGAVAWLTTFGSKDGPRQGWSTEAVERVLPTTWNSSAREGYVEWLCDTACLLERIPSGEVRFAHYAFQEFLAAWHAAQSDGVPATLANGAGEHSGVAVYFAELVLSLKEPRQQSMLIGECTRDGLTDLHAFLIVAGAGSTRDVHEWVQRCFLAWTLAENRIPETVVPASDALARVNVPSGRRDEIQKAAGSIGRDAGFATWLRTACWMAQAGLGVLPPNLADPLENALARACVRAPPTNEVDRAVGRVIRGGPPNGLAEPWQDQCLRYWPSRRRKIAQILQLVAALRPTRDKFDSVARRLLTSLADMQSAASRELAQFVAPFMCYGCILQSARGFAFGYPECLIRPWAIYLVETWSGIFNRSDLVPKMPTRIWGEELTIPGHLASRWFGTTLAGDGVFDSYTEDLASPLSWVARMGTASGVPTESERGQGSYPWVNSACEYLGLNSSDRDDADLVGMTLHCGGTAGFPILHQPALETEQTVVTTLLRDAARERIWPELEEPIIGLETLPSEYAITPFWGALVGWLRGQATSAQTDLLKRAAADPASAPEDLSESMRWLIRGDILTTSGVITLDEVCARVGVPNLPLIEPLPELPLVWPAWANTGRPSTFESEQDYFAFERALWPSNGSAVSEHPPTGPERQLVSDPRTSVAVEVEVLERRKATKSERPSIVQIDAALTLPYQAITPGTLLDRYRLLEPIGRGKFGEIWKAEDTSSGVLAAVKVFQPRNFDDSDIAAAAERFHDGAAAMRKLQGNPHVIEILDGPDVHGCWVWFAMKLYPARDLEHWIEGRMVDLQTKLRLTRQLISALKTAHLMGIRHRDVRPGNILIEEAVGGPRAVLTDFDIAYYEDELRARGATTRVVGVGRYIPPDVVGAADQSLPEVTRWRGNDLYALAIVLLDLLCARAVDVSRKSSAVLAQLPQRTRANPNGLSRSMRKRLAQFFTKALAAENPDRFQTAEEFERALSLATAELGASNVLIFLTTPLVALDCLLLFDWLRASQETTWWWKAAAALLGILSGSWFLAAIVGKFLPRVSSWTIPILEHIGPWRKTIVGVTVFAFGAAVGLVVWSDLLTRIKTAEVSDGRGCIALARGGNLMHWFEENRVATMSVAGIDEFVCPQDGARVRVRGLSMASPSVPIRSVEQLRVPLDEVTVRGPLQLGAKTATSRTTFTLAGVKLFDGDDPSGAGLRSSLPDGDWHAQFPARGDGTSVELWRGDKNVGVSLLERGLVQVDFNGNAPPGYEDIEKRARADRAGRWATLVETAKTATSLASCPTECCAGFPCEARTDCAERWKCELCRNSLRSWRLMLYGVRIADMAQWSDVRVCLNAGEACVEQCVLAKDSGQPLGRFDCVYSGRDLQSIFVKVLGTKGAGPLTRIAQLRQSLRVEPKSVCQGFALSGFEARNGQVFSVHLRMEPVNDTQ